MGCVGTRTKTQRIQINKACSPLFIDLSSQRQEAEKLAFVRVRDEGNQIQEERERDTDRQKEAKIEIEEIKLEREEEISKEREEEVRREREEEIRKEREEEVRREREEERDRIKEKEKIEVINSPEKSPLRAVKENKENCFQSSQLTTLQPLHKYPNLCADFLRSINQLSIDILMEDSSSPTQPFDFGFLESPESGSNSCMSNIESILKELNSPLV